MMFAGDLHQVHPRSLLPLRCQTMRHAYGGFSQLHQRRFPTKCDQSGMYEQGAVPGGHRKPHVCFCCDTSKHYLCSFHPISILGEPGGGTLGGGEAGVPLPFRNM